MIHIGRIGIYLIGWFLFQTVIGISEIFEKNETSRHGCTIVHGDTIKIC